jgi:HK97 family phage major capsid protein
MKRSKFILAFLFSMLLGTIVMLQFGVPAYGILFGVLAFMPSPDGILSDNPVSGITEKDAKELLDKVKSEVSTLFNERSKGLVKDEDYQLMVSELKENVKPLEGLSEKSDKLAKALEEISKDIETLKENTTPYSIDPRKEKAEFLKALEDGAAKLKAQGGGNVTIDKTVGTMSIASSTTGTIPQADREAGIARQLRQMFTIRSLSRVFPIMSRTAEWVEQEAVEGGADMTAEGAVKSQVSWSYKVGTANVEKITDYVKITTEMLDDVPGMMGEIDGELVYRIDLKEESQLLSGTGVSPQIYGITSYAQTLDLAALAGTITAPNYYDVLGADITQIRVNGKGELAANAIVLNPVDVFLMIHSTKDTTNDYVKPITVIPNVSGNGLGQVYIWGVPVIESDTIPAGSYLVADMSRFNIRDKSGLQIQLGYENDDFTKNLVTIRGEKRLASYAKSNYTEAFIYDTFANGIVFLTKSS